jgi:hypothetical protein
MLVCLAKGHRRPDGALACVDCLVRVRLAGAVSPGA